MHCLLRDLADDIHKTHVHTHRRARCSGGEAEFWVQSSVLFQSCFIFSGRKGLIDNFCSNHPVNGSLCLIAFIWLIQIKHDHKNMIFHFNWMNGSSEKSLNCTVLSCTALSTPTQSCQNKPRPLETNSLTKVL